jgi:hypothetical protein
MVPRISRRGALASTTISVPDENKSERAFSGAGLAPALSSVATVRTVAAEQMAAAHRKPLSLDNLPGSFSATASH